MDYEKLSFHDIQKEARKINIYPLSGKGINKNFLINRIKERLQEIEERNASVMERVAKEEEKKKREEELESFVEKSPRKEPSTFSETLLRQSNEDLHDFLAPVMNKIPSMREKAIAAFEENPWSLILDELNAMDEEEYSLLEIITNRKEEDFFTLVAFEDETIYSMFEKYPVVLYSILLRRRVEDPWIQILVVLTHSFSLYPFGNFMKEPLYTKEEFHPFSNMFLYPSQRTFSLAEDYIRRLNRKISPILIFLRIMAMHLKEEIFSVSSYYGIFEDYDLPLTKDILETLFSIYEIYLQSNPKEAFIFANVVTEKILTPDQDEINLTLQFIKSSLFHDMMKEIVDAANSSDDMIIVGPYGGSLPSISHLSNMLENVLFMNNEEIVLEIANILKKFVQHRSVELLSASFGRKAAFKIYRNIEMDSFARNIVIFINFSILYIRSLLVTLFDQTKYYKPYRKRLYEFLVTLLENLKKENKKEAVNIIRIYAGHHLSGRDMKRLEKYF